MAQLGEDLADPVRGRDGQGLTTKWATKREAPPQLVDELWAHFDHGTQRAILKLYRSAPPDVLARAGENLGRIACPALVFTPGADPYIGANSGGRTPRRSATPSFASWREQATGRGSTGPSWSTTWRRSSLARLERVPAKRLLAILMAAFALAGCNGNDESEDAERTDRAAGARRDPDEAEPAQGSTRPTTKTVATGLEAPWELAFLPDGRALLTERPGRVRLLSKDLKLADEPVAEVDVAAFGESGLLGLAVDPEFEQNSFVYLYRTTDSGNEVLRYRFEGDRLTEDGTVLDGLEAAAIHDGGRLRFGPTGCST